MQENPYAKAAQAGININLLCSLARPGGPLNFILDGLLSATENRNWLFCVQKCTSLAGNCHRASKEARFSFRLPQEGIGVSGQAKILSIEENDAGQIWRLLLHLGQPVLRALRRHPRYTWKPEFTRLGTFIATNRPPARSEQLKALVREHVQQDPRPPLVLDLSAGGVRMCLPEDQARFLFSAEHLYIFFLVPSKARKGELPYAFLLKRRGSCAQTCPAGIAMRFVVLAEMDWTSTAPVHWVNIAHHGSERLQACLERYEEETYVQD
ncbi:MAG: hypothetical protein IJU37_12140 [Desulfovibrio sp.]|nr:hypothetical protein [Desulfovibrio sp.]